MAEAVLRDLVRKEGLEDKILVDSAGTGSWHVGQRPHEGTLEILKNNQISEEGLIARKITSEDLDEFDYIIAMDFQNKRDIERLKTRHAKAKVATLLEYVPQIKDKDVPDPYFTGNFNYVYKLVKQGCAALFEQIKTDHLGEN
jgi:protein-tyrosine phosphatase